MDLHAQSGNGGPKDRVIAAGYGGTDWNGTERRQFARIEPGGGGGGHKLETAIVGGIAALVAAILAIASLGDYMQRDVKTSITALSGRVDAALAEAKEWRVDNAAEMRAGFANVQTRMNDLVPERVMLERWKGLQDVDRAHTEAIGKLNERLHDGDQAVNAVLMRLQSLTDRIERLDQQPGRQR